MLPNKAGQSAFLAPIHCEQFILFYLHFLYYSSMENQRKASAAEGARIAASAAEGARIAAEGASKRLTPLGWLMGTRGGFSSLYGASRRLPGAPTACGA